VGLTCGAPAGQWGDPCVLPGSSSAAHATARSRSQRRPDRAVPEGPERSAGRCRRRRLAQPGVGGATVTSHGRHLPMGHAGDDEGSRVRTPSLTLVLGSSGFRRHDGGSGGPHGMRPHQSCEAVQQTVRCPAGRQAHWWSWPQLISSRASKHTEPHRQTAGTGSQAWSPRARRVWWTRRASLRATEITPRWPSARRLTARK
jgi:hypothetical protein